MAVVEAVQSDNMDAMVAEDGGVVEGVGSWEVGIVLGIGIDAVAAAGPLALACSLLMVDL